MTWHGRLARHWAFNVSVAAVLALTVGLNLIVFTLVNALWLRPRPFADADRIVTIIGGVMFGWLDTPRLEGFEIVAGQAATGEEFGAFRPHLTISNLSEHRDLEVAGVTNRYFSLFRLAIRGRDFSAADGHLGSELVAIISDRLWRTEFHARPDVIGSVIPSEPSPIRVIGIAPANFTGARRGERIDVWVPALAVPRLVHADVRNDELPLEVFARMRPGDSVAGVNRRLSAAGVLRGPATRAVTLDDAFGGPGMYGTALNGEQGLKVAGAVALLVLLSGCAVLATLVLVHCERRHVEFATRTALGASRAQLIGEQAAQLIVIGSLGIPSAIGVTFLGLRTVPAVRLPGGIDLGRIDLSIDWRVLTAAVALALVTLVVAAAWPIARATRREIGQDVLKGTTTTSSAGSLRIRQALLAALVGATVVVLVTAGLLVQSLDRGFGRASGFDVAHTAFVTVNLNPAPVRSLAHLAERRAITHRRAAATIDALRTIPGALEVAEGTPPIGAAASLQRQTDASLTYRGKHVDLRVGRLTGAANLLRALGIPVIAGRSLRDGDANLLPMPALITASLANALGPREQLLGEVLTTAGPPGRLVVVGIAPDFAFGSLSAPAPGVVVVPRHADAVDAAPTFVIHTEGPASSVMPAIEQAFRERLPEVAPLSILTGREVVSRDLGRQRLSAWFFSGFGVVAWMLGLGGVVTLVIYLAQSRRRECGIRAALGATSTDLILMAVTAAAVPVICGVAMGLLLAAWMSSIVASLLVGVGSLDPITYAGVAVGMVAPSIGAAIGAAWRLRHVSPVEALRMP